jgi:hypothetical protein
MSTDQYITIAILALTFALLIRSRVPPVAVFVGALTLTITFRLAPLGESLKGFSNPGMLTVGALLMVAAGMYRTGAITVSAKSTSSPGTVISNGSSPIKRFSTTRTIAAPLRASDSDFNSRRTGDAIQHKEHSISTR